MRNRKQAERAILQQVRDRALRPDGSHHSSVAAAARPTAAAPIHATRRSAYRARSGATGGPADAAFCRAAPTRSATVADAGPSAASVIPASGVPTLRANHTVARVAADGVGPTTRWAIDRAGNTIW